MNPFWRRLQRFVEHGKETEKVDFKRELHLNNKSTRAEFVKDVIAIANTPGGDGFIIVGISDSAEVSSEQWTDRVAGFTAEPSADDFHIQMIDALSDLCNPVPPTVEYDELVVPGLTKTIGIVTIRRSDKRPHSFRKDSASGKQDNVPIRRGTKTFPQASPDEIADMFGQRVPKQPTIVVNTSGRPLSPLQRQQIEEQIYIEELIDCSFHFGPPPILPQIEQLVEKIGLTDQEWQTRPIVLVPPGLPAAAATLIAYLHGRRGGFLKLAWIRPEETDRSIFNVDEIIPLQDIRDGADASRKRSGS